MRRLVTFGDSFTYGDELSDRTSAWPQQVANALSLELLNYGTPGISNDGMLRKFFVYLASSEYRPDDIIAFGWTSPGRMEFADLAGVYDIWPGIYDSGYEDFHPWRLELIAHNNQYHNAEWLYQRYLQTVIVTQMTLKGLGHQYVMMDIRNKEYYKNLFKRQYEKREDGRIC